MAVVQVARGGPWIHPDGSRCRKQVFLSLHRSCRCPVMIAGKPQPDVFLFAAGWMKTSPMRCVVVEDSVAGVTAAVAGAFVCFGSQEARIVTRTTRSAWSRRELRQCLTICGIYLRSLLLLVHETRKSG